MVDQGGTSSPLIFQTRDTGTPNSTLASTWQVDGPSFTDCSNFDADDNDIVKGNVVVRP